MINQTNGRGDAIQRLQSLDEQYFAARKERESEIASTYSSGEVSRMNPVPRGIDPLGADADSHYRTEYNYFLHVERGRAAVRNHPLVEQGINRLVANLRLDGFTLDVNSGDESVDADQKDDWRMWSGETMAGQSLCDYEGTRSFQQIARQSFFSRCQDGDIVHLPTVDGRIQTWESHHVRTPFNQRRFSDSDQNGIIHGAEVRNGKTVAYWITPFNLRYHQSLAKPGQARRFPVFDKAGNKITFWMGHRHRFFQRRGISRLSAPRDAMTGFEDLNYSNIKSSLRRALIAYLMEDAPNASPSMDGLGSTKLPQSGSRYTSNDVGLGLQAVTIEQQGEPAQVFRVPDGKTMSGWNANLPPSSFFEHSALLLQMLAVNLDIPLSFLLLDGSMTNFHGGRMIWDQVKLRLQQLQKDEIQGLWGPSYELRTRQRLTPGHPLFDPVLAAAVERGANPYKYTFRPRGWAYAKPAEDVAAETAAERGNVKSMRAILSERGVDFDDHILEVIADRASWMRLSLATARKIAERNPDLDLSVVEVAKELRHGADQVSGMQEVQQMADQQNQQGQAKEASE